MAEQLQARAPAIGGNRRLVEWSLLIVLISILILVFGREIRVLQGQAELARFKASVGALRTALVLQHLQQQARPDAQSVAFVQRNPFRLLEREPANYAGEIGAAALPQVAPGDWVFDAACGCIGYAPLQPQWLDSPSGESMVWLRVSAPPGPLRLALKEPYRWQGQAMD